MKLWCLTQGVPAKISLSHLLSIVCCFKHTGLFRFSKPIVNFVDWLDCVEVF